MELHARLTDPLAAKLRAAAAASHPPPPHNDSWVHSLLLRDGRALNRIAVPWCLVMSATLAWCVPTLVTGRDRHALDLSRCDAGD